MELNLMDVLNQKTEGNFERQLEIIKTSFQEVIKRNLVLKEAIYYDDVIDEESEGFLLEFEDKKIFYAFPRRTMEIKIEEDVEITDADLMTLAIVHDIHMDVTGMNIRAYLKNDIPEEEFNNWTNSFLRVVESGLFVCPFVDEIESNFEELLESEFVVLTLSGEDNEEEVQEIEHALSVEPEVKEETKTDEIPVFDDSPQLSFFPIEEDSKKEEEKKTKAKRKKKTSKKTSEKVEKEAQVVQQNVTVDEVKKLRPDIFDDSWVEEYLSNFEFSDEDYHKFLRLVKKYRAYRREKYLVEMNRPDALLFVDDEENFKLYRGYEDVIRKAISSVLVDTNLLLSGETSTGKTTLIQTLSKLLIIPMFTVNGSRDLDIETLIGFRDLDDGNIIVKNAGLINAMELGGMLYIDEANLILPSVLGLTHGALDHRKTIYNQLTGEIVKGDKDFLVTAAINDRYQDTVEMNTATKDRFVVIEMTYMAKEHLMNMLEEFDGFGKLQKELFKTDVSDKDVWVLTDIATALQQAVKSEQISPEVASIRNIIDLLKLSRLLSWDEAISMIVEKYDIEERENIVAALENVEGIDIDVEDVVRGVIRSKEEVY